MFLNIFLKNTLLDDCLFYYCNFYELNCSTASANAYQKPYWLLRDISIAYKQQIVIISKHLPYWHIILPLIKAKIFKSAEIITNLLHFIGLFSKCNVFELKLLLNRWSMYFNVYMFLQKEILSLCSLCLTSF